MTTSEETNKRPTNKQKQQIKKEKQPKFSAAPEKVKLMKRVCLA